MLTSTLTTTAAAIKLCASDTVEMIPAHRSASQVDPLPSFLPPTPANTCDVERATCSPFRGLHDKQALGVDHAACVDDINLPILPTAVAMRSLAPDRINESYSQSQYQSSILVNRSSVGDDGSPVHGEGTTAVHRLGHEPAFTAILPWYIRTLEFLTMYNELCTAHVHGDFTQVRTRLQREWAFNGGFLLAIAGVNVAMFALTPDAIFKVNTYIYTAVSISSAACGLGVACDVWFLIRYNWVDLEIFVHRSRDVYDSYVFFSMSSRIPTFCVLVASTSLMISLGLVAYDAGHVGVLVIGVPVVLVMILQYVVYGADQFFKAAFRVWKTMADFTIDVVRGFQGLWV